jgi:hypothetical protein
MENHTCEFCKLVKYCDTATRMTNMWGRYCSEFENKHDSECDSKLEDVA